jgi:hypothetical protein
MTVMERSALHQAIDKLPEIALVELASYVEFLQFKAQHNVPKPTRQKRVKVLDKSGENGSASAPPYRPVYFPRGIAKGLDLSLEQIAEARKELWRGFGGSLE